MTDSRERDGLIAAFAIGIPALVAFHEYSTYLSSPWTTQKLAEDGDESSLWRLYWEATAATFLWTGATGIALAWGTGEIWPLIVSLISAAGVAAWIYTDYDRALKGLL